MMICETASRGVGFKSKIFKLLQFLGSVAVVRHPGHSRNTLRRNGNYVRYVRYADDVRSRNPVKTQNCENRRQQQDDLKIGLKIETTTMMTTDGRRAGGGSVEISLENNPFSAGSGKTGEKREERGKGEEEEEVLTPRRIGGYRRV